MCGLPTETDDDVLQIADLAKKVIAAGREISGSRDIRCTVSIGGFVPKPHTPFQWASQLGAEETDEDVLQIAEMARNVIKAGREATGSRDIRCTVSIGGFVPKPHTPFQWCGQLDAEATDARLRKLRDVIRNDKQYGRAIGFRYHDGKPGIVEGLLSRGDRRVGKVIRAVWEDGGRFDGWSEYFSYDRWMAAAERAFKDESVDVAWYTVRDREQVEVLPWDHLDSGLDRDWLWEDWQDALRETEVDDCRWTPCFDCGVCPQMGTEIQVGPTGKKLLPLSVV